MERKKPTMNKLFVGLVGPDTTNTSLRAFIQRFVDVHIAKVETSRRSGKKKGFGYVICEHNGRSEMELPSVKVLDGKTVFIAPYVESLTSTWHHIRSQAIKVMVDSIPLLIKEHEVVKMLECFGVVLVSDFNSDKQQNGSSSTKTMQAELVKTSECLTLINRMWGKLSSSSSNLIWDFQELCCKSNRLRSKECQLQITQSYLSSVFGLVEQSRAKSRQSDSTVSILFRDKHSNSYPPICCCSEDNYRFNIMVQRSTNYCPSVLQNVKGSSPWGCVMMKKLGSTPSSSKKFKSPASPSTHEFLPR